MPAQPLQALPTRNPARARRTVLTLAAAAFVVLVPTACDYAVATTGSGSGSGSTIGTGSAHGGHGGVAPETEIETIPAGSVEDLEPDPDDGTIVTGSVDEPATPDASAAPDASDAADPDAADPDAPDATGTADPDVPDASGTADPDAPDASATADPGASTTTDPAATTTAAAPAPPAAGGLAILGDDCTTSDLEPHDGFQNAPRCVAIAFGEVAAAAQSPSLLITEAPATLASGEDFTLTVSTRNLIRDRFLGAAAGGYYRESSFLNADGLQRGHFHTACRMLGSTDVAPDAEPAPAFFLATQDNGGGAEPDQVVIPVTGLEGTGTAQCAVWAGDGSHRVPMMQRANQTPAFDIVRITVE